jgi:hypothetical protein
MIRERHDTLLLPPLRHRRNRPQIKLCDEPRCDPVADFGQNEGIRTRRPARNEQPTTAIPQHGGRIGRGGCCAEVAPNTWWCGRLV